jgi:queuosine biosynthesis protein QueC
MNKPKAVVLLSGGLDSATVLAMAIDQGFDAYAMSFRYGQRHVIELEKAKEVAQHLGATRHIVVEIDLRAFGGSALTSDIAVPKGRSAADMSHGIPSTYVPARNTIFLSFALAWAEVVGSGDIFVGVNALDYSGYPDRRPEYIRAFERMANLATKGATFRPTKPLPQHWMSIALGRSGMHMNAIASAWNPERGTYELGEVRAEVVMTGPYSKAFYGLLEKDRVAIDAAFGELLTWYNPTDQNVCRIYVRRDADIRDRTLWPDQHRWLKAKLERLRAVFKDRAVSLDPTEWRPQGP